MHIIICGLGQVGYRVLEELIRLNEKVVMISTIIKREHDKLIQKNNIRLVIGDAREEDVLIKAGVSEAKAIITLTSNDVANIEISLKAKEINPNISTMVRIYDELLANRIKTGFGIERAFSTSALAASGFVSAVLSEKIRQYIKFGKKSLFIFEWTITKRSTLLNKTVKECKQHLGIEPLLITNKDKKPEIPVNSYRFNLYDKVLFFSTSINLLKMTNSKELRVRSKRKSLTDSFKDKFCEVISSIKNSVKRIPIAVKMLIAVFSLFLLVSVWVFHKALNWSVVDSFYFVISTSATVGYGDLNLKDATPWVKLFDCLVIIGGAALIASFFSLITEVIVSNKINEYFGLNKINQKDHVVVAGLGSLGYRVADSLIAVGEKVIGIEKKLESESLAIMKGKIPIITGDATSIQVLNRIGIARAKALVAVTDDDIVNLGIALHAKEINPSIRIVIRIFDKEFGQRIQENYGIHGVLCASQLVASTFAAGLMDRNVEKSFWWDDQHLVILVKDITRTSFLRGLSKLDIVEKYDIIPIMCKNNHGNKHIDDDYKLTEGDKVVLICNYDIIKKLNE